VVERVADLLGGVGVLLPVRLDPDLVAPNPAELLGERLPGARLPSSDAIRNA
jgi:hypothetical protein